MKWTREYDRYGNVVRYISGRYTIRRQNSTNIFTGKPMAEQYWDILRDGIKIDFAITLKEAKARAEANEASLKDK